MSNRPEIAYLVQNILPLFAAQFSFPSPEDEQNTKIDEIPIRIGSGIKKPDTVYFWEKIPIFLIEAKKEGKSEEDAVNQALSYIRNFPVETYSKNGIRPRYFAVTIGKNIFFYAHRYEIEKDNFKDWAEKLEVPMLFPDLLKEYGLKKIEKTEILTPDIFRKEVLNELGPIYKFEDKITPAVVNNTSHQILSFLQYGRDFTSHRPYTDLEGHKDRQAQIRQLYEKFNWIDSLGPEVAKEFRSYILRSFQGTNLNQYLTEQCVIAFMVNLTGELKPETAVLDFECGSGGFLAAVIEKGVLLQNIMGIDIDELPYIIAKTYLALYFGVTGKDGIDDLPIKKDNGLYYHGNDWDLIIGNPAGGNKYENGNLEEIGGNLDRDLDRNGRLDDNLSEYNLSIQQAVSSVKVGGKFCLVLPEGFFSNSQDEFLRKFVSKYCKVLAIVSLPRGVFKKGTSTRQQQRGSQTSSQKMSILYAQKIRDIDKDNPSEGIDFQELNYSVFLASIDEPESKSGQVCEWLEPALNIVYEQWQEWLNADQLKTIPVVNIESNKQKKKPQTIPLFEEKGNIQTSIQLKPKEAKSKTKISKFLENIFS